MSSYQTKAFRRFAKDKKISDQDLRQAATDVLNGRADADLGGGVYKQRVARDAGGKSTGFRTLIIHKTSRHCFFVLGFAKNDKGNIDRKELKALKGLADELGKLSDAAIETAVKEGAFVEVAEPAQANEG